MSSQNRKRKRDLPPNPATPHQKLHLQEFKYNSTSSSEKEQKLQLQKFKYNSTSSTDTPKCLCSTCRKIDFTNIFTTPVTEKTGSQIAYIGTISSLSLTCPFCQFLKQIISLSPPSSTDHEEAEYALRAFPALSTIGYLISRTNISFMPQVTSTSVLGLIHAEPSNSQGKQKVAQQVLKKWGYICPTSFPYSVPHPYITARRVEPKEMDYVFIKSWMDFCEKNHKKTCTRLENTKIPSLRVIDCETRRVIEEPGDGRQNRYVAMSYVWGLKDKDPTKHKVCKDTGALPDSLPTVISDAMRVVLGLGLRYLWVDRYCIVQDDEVDVLKHMEIMDLIYNHAFLTIVAAAGKDSEHGLPGVSIEKVEQSAIEIEGQMLVSTLPDPQDVVGGSIWMTRGWTYQEALFSIRRLLFTPTQVYFECNNMQCCEAVNLPLKPLHTTDQRRFRTCLRHGLFRGGFGKRCWPLSTHIVNYSARGLSFDSDVLRGMFGIFRTFEVGRVPIHNVMGIPLEYDLDLLNWKQQESMRQQYINNPWKLHASFARGLCWRLKEPGERRDGFPSWSWAGWKGPLSEWFEFESLSKWEDPAVRFEVAFEHSGIADLNALYNQKLGRSRLQISRDFLSVGVEAWSFAASVISDPSEPSSYLVQVQLKTGGSVFSNLILDSVSDDGLCEQEWTCLILAYRKQASRSPVAVVIGKQNTIWERIGLVDFWVSWKMEKRRDRVQEVFDDNEVEKKRWQGQLS